MTPGYLESPSSRRAWIEISFPESRTTKPAPVALLAEGVDRNFCVYFGNGVQEWSPSSRRAWIEISTPPTMRVISGVALLAEGVDRNTDTFTDAVEAKGRPPRGGRG